MIMTTYFIELNSVLYAYNDRAAADVHVACPSTSCNELKAPSLLSSHQKKSLGMKAEMDNVPFRIRISPYIHKCMDIDMHIDMHK